ncbi:3-dehydroquinate synthase/2-deoxy-scyllo-inosose synthase [Actinoalloteichus hoggarensis]|uniref:2-deoxy-scyllo-inosose synthase n=1 Tax=Actinoalloteichus hoggarensis TaxID=1470176 RepID=A0A221VZL1_9PSEU|nr:2-deoxy-scyllo-inosose synthase [Actinoalloteichus hoggarensis]ASO18731.1 2-deoxy-scyllo-inosose synthase [Actinoalloteichus hoggarensis]MBB5919964.1 3-dehydroquinate synthase/2-deoxy-scyllo-inosose synthase [Actinoalloteichus hoggarensis]
MATRNEIGAEEQGRLQVRQVRIGDTEYPYRYGADCVDLILQELATMNADRFIVVTDDTVLGLHGAALLSGLGGLAPVEVVSHPPGEGMKTLDVLAGDIERVIACGATRRSVVIAFGGGVPGNLAGVVAALLFRGVRLVHIPTTTTAAMDSVLSLKQAINSRRGKNHIGTYLPPYGVFTDVRMLTTLPERELRSGLCEAAKNCLAIRPGDLPMLRRMLDEGRLASPEALSWLLEVSIAAKTGVTAADSFERRAGLVLEYGHTVGHAVELVDHRRHGPDGLSHGESIAFGMLVAARISHARGRLSAEDVRVHDEIVAALGAPTRLPEGMTVDEVLAVVRDDNKRGYLPDVPGQVPFVLLDGLGVPAGEPELPLVPVDLAEVRSALEALVPEAATVRGGSAVGMEIR